VESVGTGDWHVGHPPDPRATAAARGRGIVLEGAARQVTREDLRAFDLVLAADRDNRDALLALAGGDPDARRRIRLLREFDPASAAGGDLEVPDPYFGGRGRLRPRARPRRGGLPRAARPRARRAATGVSPSAAADPGEVAARRGRRSASASPPARACRAGR
jgi:protein-tyrosine phosphatase